MDARTLKISDAELKNQCEAEIRKARRSGALIGVFVVGGQLASSRSDSDRFDSVIFTHAHALVGCYDDEATPDQVFQDVKALTKQL